MRAGSARAPRPFLRAAKLPARPARSYGLGPPIRTGRLRRSYRVAGELAWRRRDAASRTCCFLATGGFPGPETGSLLAMMAARRAGASYAFTIKQRFARGTKLALNRSRDSRPPGKRQCMLFPEHKVSPTCIDDQMAPRERIIVANVPAGRVKMKVGGSLSSYTFARRQLIMTRLSSASLGFVAIVSVATLGAAQVHAQCNTCGTQTVFSPVIAQPQATVAFSPVVSTPVVVAQPVRTGWYPGRLLDNWRMNRWANTTAWGASTVAVAPAPVVQTVGFAPTAAVQTVNFAPSAPYVTGYAPLQRTVVSYAPTTTTVFSPAVIEPVVSASACSACTACEPAAPCSACAGAATVEQASYLSPVTTVAPATGCSSCAEAASSVPQYSYPASPATSTVPPTTSSANPPTPQPSLAEEPTPAAGSQQYGAQRPETNGAESAAPESEQEKSVVEPKPMADEATGDTSTFQAPALLNPTNDRTANRPTNRPTVDIHDAVYRQPVRKSNVGATTVAKPVTPVSTAAPATDAHGWYAVGE
jgi:hypothetical protein